MDAGEDCSRVRGRLRAEMVRLRGHVESYLSERLEGSLAMKEAARNAVDSTASFLDGLAATLAAGPL